MVYADIQRRREAARLRQQRFRAKMPPERRELERRKAAARMKRRRGRATAEDFALLQRVPPPEVDPAWWGRTEGVTNPPLPSPPKRTNPSGRSYAKGSGQPARPAEEPPMKDGREKLHGILARLVERVGGRRAPARARGPGESVSRVRRLLGRGESLLRQLGRWPLERALCGLLEAAEFFDLNPNRRVRWARALAVRLGPSAVGLLVCLLADIVSDPRVCSVGAVLAHRLPSVLSAEPEKCLSERGPKSVREALGIHEPVPAVVYDQAGRAPVNELAARDALRHYRQGVGLSEIAAKLGLSEAETRDSITWGLKTCMDTEE